MAKDKPNGADAIELAPPDAAAPQWDANAPRFVDAGKLLDADVRLRRLQPEQVLALRVKFAAVGLTRQVTVAPKTRPTLVAALQAALVGPASNKLLFAGEPGQRQIDSVSGETLRKLATLLCEFNGILA